VAQRPQNAREKKYPKGLDKSGNIEGSIQAISECHITKSVFGGKLYGIALRNEGTRIRQQHHLIDLVTP
jgi:hypothetical protein